MSTALATIQAEELETMQRTAKMMMASGFFGGKGEEGIAQIAVKIMAGREMGYGPFASVRGIHVIQGSPTLSANLMAAAVKGSGKYTYLVRKMEDDECAIEFFEMYQGKRDSIGVSTFTIADAKRANTKNMGAFPRNMLFARAMSNGVRWYCPDVFSGNSVYTPEELGARTDDEGYIIVDRASGEVIESPKLPPVKPASKLTEAPPSIESLDDEEELPFDEKSDAEREWDELSSVEPGQPSSAGAVAKMSAKALQRFNILGRELYPDNWDDKRPEIVGAFTKKRTTSSKELTADEASALIEMLEKRTNKLAAESQAVPA